MSNAIVRKVDSSGEQLSVDPLKTEKLVPRTLNSIRKPVRSEDKLLLSRREVASLLSISQRAVDYLIANKMLSVRRIGSRVLIPLEDLHRFARADHPERLAG